METFAVIGSHGVLEVFNEGTESYTTAFIVNQNPVMDETERDRDHTDCSISSVAVMTGNGSLVDIDSGGFSAPIDLLGGRSTHVQVSFILIITGLVLCISFVFSRLISLNSAIPGEIMREGS